MNQCGTHAIETDRLTLRQFSFSDCEDVLQNWASDPLVQSLYSEPVYSTEAEVMALLKKYIGHKPFPQKGLKVSFCLFPHIG